MTFDAARPRHTLSLAGKEYDLIGTMEMVEAIEHQLKKGIGRVAIEVVEGMPSSELARLLSAILTGCGHPTSHTEAKEVIWTSVGLSGEVNSELRLHLYAFLSICLAPPEMREAKAREMGEMFGKLIRPAASRGKRTRNSASGG